MKILVTGAAGFIGSHLCEKLKADGHDVFGIDCFTDYYDVKLKRLNEADLKKKSIFIHNLDLAADDLAQVLDGVNIVYHLAAQPGISDKVSFETYLRNNIEATFKLLEACRKSDSLKLFVNIATSSVYGKMATENEEAAPAPISNYGVTKLGAEQLALSYDRAGILPATSCRLYCVYGPRERPEKLYPSLIKSIFEDKPFPLFEGSENHVRSYSYVGDVVAGLVSVMDHMEECKGEIFNIGIDKTITTGEGIKIIEDIIGKKAKIEKKPKRPGDQEKTHTVIDKARRILGYEPKTEPAEGLKKEVEWFREKFYK